jgi:hypothetical protein
MVKSIGKYQYTFISQFMKKNMDTIEYINGIPKVVFIFWFSNKDYIPEFSVRRYNALQSLINNIKVPAIIITKENYKFFEIPDFPYNKSLEYLSGNHKSDYLRAYILHHYGGGYHDIKWREKSWENEWDKFKDENIWIIGRRELKSDNIGYGEGQEWVTQKYESLVTMSWVIMRKNNEYIKTVLNKINNILDSKYELLKKNPAPNERCGNNLNCDNSQYPLRWLEIMGEISHPLQLNYIEHTEYTLPDILYKTYK